MKLHRSLPLALAAVAAMSSCEHKDLCFNHFEHAGAYKTDVVASYNLVWESDDNGHQAWEAKWQDSFGMHYGALCPQMPEGLCVTAYSATGGRTEVNHLPPTGGLATMSGGDNSVLFYNDDTEFIIFDNLNASVSAKATTRSRSRASYTGNPLYRAKSAGEERTVTPPDNLFCHYMERYTQQAVSNPLVLDVTLQPVVYTYLVRYEFEHGVEYVRMARGAMAGMAESVFLFDGHTGPDRATILYDCTIESWGVQAIVNSFGVPDYPAPSFRHDDNVYAINLEVKLRNGKVFNFNFDISGQMRTQPHGGVITVCGIRIEDKDAEEGGSGFDVDVDDWGDFNDIIVQL